MKLKYAVASVLVPFIKIAIDQSTIVADFNINTEDPRVLINLNNGVKVLINFPYARRNSKDKVLVIIRIIKNRIQHSKAFIFTDTSNELPEFVKELNKILEVK